MPIVTQHVHLLSEFTTLSTYLIRYRIDEEIYLLELFADGIYFLCEWILFHLMGVWKYMGGMCVWMRSGVSYGEWYLRKILDEEDLSVTSRIEVTGKKASGDLVWCIKSWCTEKEGICWRNEKEDSHRAIDEDDLKVVCASDAQTGKKAFKNNEKEYLVSASGIHYLMRNGILFEASNSYKKWIHLITNNFLSNNSLMTDRFLCQPISSRYTSNTRRIAANGSLWMRSAGCLGWITPPRAIWRHISARYLIQSTCLLSQNLTQQKRRDLVVTTKRSISCQPKASDRSLWFAAKTLENITML